MKKLIIFCVAVTCSASVFAAPLRARSVDEISKIRKVFLTNFPEIRNPSIVNVGDYYLVSFIDKKDNSVCRISYDEEGNVIETIRNYSAEGLAPFLRSKINSKYKGKEIFMVTDVSNANEHYYQVILQDAKSMWMVHADDNGSMYVQKKYKRAS
ncbi:MAG: hypothetical protein ACTHNG_09110 [Ginsengibacter sp.]|nr:hypothetical protein [Hanamia sp.]